MIMGFSASSQFTRATTRTQSLYQGTGAPSVELGRRVLQSVRADGRSLDLGKRLPLVTGLLGHGSRRERVSRSLNTVDLGRSAYHYVMSVAVRTTMSSAIHPFGGQNKLCQSQSEN